MTSDYIIITNSPGELSAWVFPVSAEIKLKDANSRVIVLLVPCFYSTGREKAIAENCESVDMVLEPKDFLKIAFNLTPKGFSSLKSGAVISLGGDPWHAVLVSRRLKLPALLYTMKKADTCRYFKHIFVMQDSLKRKFMNLGVKEHNITVVGDLMQDGVKPCMTEEETRAKAKLSKSSKVVAFFPGSRLSHVRESLPVFMKTAEEIKVEIPKIEFVICLSPFVTFDDIKVFIAKKKRYNIDGTWGTLEDSYIVTAGGVRIKIERDNRYDIINVSTLVITIPGTNTAEIASLGKPMIVAFTWKAKVPSGGLGFLANLLPFTGMLKKMIMTYMYRNVKYKGLPNALADREITPEVIVDESSSQLSSVAIDLLRDEERLSVISKELLAVMGGGGAASKIADKSIQIAKES